MHCGGQYCPRMNSLQRQVAQHLTSLGVQLIIGCHPHVEQSYSYQDNQFVAYSLGNLVFLHSMTPEKFIVSRSSCDMHLVARKSRAYSLSSSVTADQAGETLGSSFLARVCRLFSQQFFFGKLTAVP